MLELKFKNIVFIILYAIPNVILSFSILYIINNVLTGKEGFLKEYMGFIYGSIVIYTYLLNIIFQEKLNKYTYNLLYENEKEIFKKILHTPLITLEKYGSQRFYTVIEDVRVFGAFSTIVTHTINSILMVLLCLSYMFLISIYSALIVLGLITIIALVFFIVINTMSRKISILRENNEHYYNYVNDVIKGFKELKIDAVKRKNLMKKYLSPNRDESKNLDYKINFVFLSINLISQYGLYLIIGAILFILPALDFLSREEIAPYVVILLFLTGPVNNLINMQNVYSQYMVSNRRIKKFLIDFKNDQSDGITELEEGRSVAIFNSIEFKDVSFIHEGITGKKTFELGPINLKINKGEIIFIIGGNGSGKSTFINVLTGLYQPSGGELVFNCQDTGIDHINANQNLLTTIFTDNHIFSNNYDDYILEKNKKYTELLELMELEKIILDDKEESARRPFSKGQSKRMSMIFALLESKPILVLDEWAADQDPYFRKYFYENLLPKLKQEGKTIIAVTHDDAYFKYADRILKFDYGQIVKDFKIEDKILSKEYL